MPVADHRLLFVRLRKHFPDRENCPENYLTDCVAAALVADPLLARKWISLLLGAERLEEVDLDGAEIEVHTQVREDGESIPDLVFEVIQESRRIRIGVEHKLGAAEGVNQLGRYVRLPGLWGVAAVTRRGVRTHMAELTSGCAKWLHPIQRTHWTWTDLYPIVEYHANQPGAHALTRALLGLFDDLQFAPEHPEVGRLGRGGSDEERGRRSEFFDNWAMTEPLLRARGWRTHPGKNSQLYFIDRDTKKRARVERGILSPLADEGRTLRVKLRYRSLEQRDAARAALRTALGESIPSGQYVTHSALKKKRAEGLCYFLDVNIPMARVLPVGVEANARRRALAAYVDAVLTVVD